MTKIQNIKTITLSYKVKPVDDLSMICCYDGRPLTDCSQPELIEMIMDLLKEVETLRDENRRRSVEHIYSLAEAAKQRLM